MNHWPTECGYMLHITVQYKRQGKKIPIKVQQSNKESIKAQTN